MATKQIPHGSDVERMILAEIRMRVKHWERIVSEKEETWKQAEERVLAYLPERDVDAARKTAREGGLPQYTTIQIPYSYGVLMAAHTYLTSVFMGRHPVFQYAGRHGEAAQQTQAMEALIDYQVTVGGMLPVLYTWLYDALKYGFGAMGIYWDTRHEMVPVAQSIPMTDFFGNPTGESVTEVVPQMMRSYAGNRLYNVQPQDFIWDVRYPVKNFQQGEYCGRRFRLGWNEVKRREKTGFYMNIQHLKARGQDTQKSMQGSDQLQRPETFADMSWGEESGYTKGRPMAIDAVELVIELIPKEWRLGESDWPEKWVFTCTQDYATLIGAEPLGAFHAKFPYQVLPLEPEGYGLTTRGLPEILTPVQNTVDWLINSHFYNVRAALNNRFVVDPSRVVLKDVLDPLPGGVIRLKPEAYGSDTKTVVSQLPTADVTQAHMADLPAIIGIGERTVGVNDQVMGMLESGSNRKTATEVRTSTSFSINRLKTIAEFASACAFEPASQMLVQNSQQFYDMELKFKIAGDLVMSAGEQFITVRPDTICGAYDFVPVDGTLPIDRLAQANMWREMFREVATIPQIGMQYDLGGIFEWVAQLMGLKNITRFKIQMMPGQMLAGQAGMGNVIPLQGPKAAGPGVGVQPTGTRGGDSA